VASSVGGLDGLLVGTVQDRRGAPPQRSPDGYMIPVAELKIQVRLIDVDDSSVVNIQEEENWIGLSDAAYMGESWELRRWSGNRLQIIGLVEPDDMPPGGNVLYGRGPVFESMHYRSLRPGMPHPLQNRECPYKLSIFVDGQRRSLENVDGKVYAALDPGEEYEIRVENQSHRPAYLCLFVDGASVLGKKRQHPLQARYWYLRPKRAFAFAGWFTGSEGRYEQERFIISPASDAVAAGQGFGQQLGLITAVFYTVGMDNIPEVRVAFGADMGYGMFGTGAGAASDVRLQERSGPERGLMLTAMTVYYATSADLEELRQ
jgi:hypothetical protein